MLESFFFSFFLDSRFRDVGGICLYAISDMYVTFVKDDDEEVCLETDDEDGFP